MADDEGHVPKHTDVEGVGLPGSVARDAEEATQRTARERDIIPLTARDSLAFARSLLDPPPPNDALIRAFHHHATLIGDE